MRPPLLLSRLHLSIQGLLQGIGFRPFIYNLAHAMGLTGWIQNSPQGVSIEVEGEREKLDDFLQRVLTESPPNAFIHHYETSYLAATGYEHFEIRESKSTGEQSTLISPDIATCSDCLQELFDPANSRYLYPFTNCSHCGPRFSIIESLPYDRQNTAMKIFEMCAVCQNEYNNPRDRRFHAQPTACPDCGPYLEFWDSKCLSKRKEALDATVTALRDGAIVAVKGLAGFHLMVSACDDDAVRRLRLRKQREAKPFALMFPDLQSVKKLCECSLLEEQLLLSQEAPIVLLQRRLDAIQNECFAISREVAPSTPCLGVMFPSNPLHHILMRQLNAPVIATSGNVSDETICTQDEEAFSRLHGIADFFLIHNRPIVRAVDDSIVREILGSPQVLRRSRGYAPSPITCKNSDRDYISVGAYLKNTIALAKHSHIILSQHIGDLGNLQTTEAFESTIQSFTKLYDIQPDAVACDFHPDYASTEWADKNHENLIPVQHHVAHLFSCMAEHDLEGPLLGVTWDGSGYGLDGTLWGGEFFHVKKESIHRVACWKPFPLPGAEAAMKEPRRSALGLLYSVLDESIFDRPELMKFFNSEETVVLKTMLDKKLNCPVTSSCGRLFDAVASMTGIRQVNSFEAQAAIELEFFRQGSFSESYYPVDLVKNSKPLPIFKNNKIIPACYDLNLKYHLDQTSLVRELLQDIVGKCSLNLILTKFHNALAESIVSVAKQIGEERVLLSGGCFQNKFLTERTVQRLLREGFHPYWHQRIPPNDGGLALGQIFAASWSERKKEGFSCA
ncbi:MAG: carbamoyltransferase HypF [Nitrospinae bacterium CG11_big_fil_rev_8_21_14_0_20_45_15]|nr:MAG: carbamoyltransferase HypF [Nitrospinae bacterium CG11_big_fil_rev_8_21_14_0_20_45_15]